MRQAEGGVPFRAAVIGSQRRWEAYAMKRHLRYLAWLPVLAVLTEFSLAAETVTSHAARCHSLKGPPAVTACLAAIKANSNEIALRRRLGFAYLEADLYSKSIDSLRQITKSRPNDWQAHFDLASVFGFLQAYPSAVAPIERAMQLSPEHLRTLMLATIIYRNVKRDKDVYRVALRAAQLGERIAMFMSSYHYESGVGTNKDLSQARHWMAKAAAAGHVGAMDRLTQGYLNGEMGFKPDSRLAEVWAARARKARLHQ